MSKRLTLALLLALSACASLGPSLSPDASHTIVLTGDLARADNQTYRELPFDVPRGVTSLNVEFSYTGRQDHTVIDLGVRDPDGPRGWSGGNKSGFTIGEVEATPSYAPGHIQPGRWLLVLGVPNIREGSASHYEARITFESSALPVRREITRAIDPVLSKTAGWRRGDFHTHTGHSDGSCETTPNQRGPCPVSRTADAARASKLDFVAITDHNTLSQRGEIEELQLSYRDLLLIPSTEITTFHGHANAIGLKTPLEFELGSPRLPTLSNLLDNVAAQSAILSVNHPALPSDESCLGCGWTVADTDWSRVAAMEIVNGGTLRLGREESATSGIPVWEKLLDQGYRITAIGGSDNHDATDRTGRNESPVGAPATVVWASQLSARGIVDGVKSGHVFLDLSNTPGTVIDIEARSNAGTTAMGGVLSLAPGVRAQVSSHVEGVRDVAIELVSHGLTRAGAASGPASGEAEIQLAPGSTSGWIRAQARNSAGKLVLIGNPIYVRAR